MIIVEKLNKCNQGDFAGRQSLEKSQTKATIVTMHYADATNLRTHLKTHSGEKLHKCNRYDFASSWTNSGFGLESLHSYGI